MPNVLFASSEALPLVKTGGLADVAGALPAALAALGLELRVVMPAYRGCRAKLADARPIGSLLVRGQHFTVIEGRPSPAAPLFWLIEHQGLYEREGDPYHDAQHRPWPDNAWRFGCFAEAVARLAQGEGNGGWRADVLHGNDWQAGLALAWLAQAEAPVRRIFTIHNLAYAGVFPRAEFDALGLPPAWWAIDGIEFHGQWSALKAGIQHADAITTVSPSYAREIREPEFGHGLDGLLRWRGARLHGILNGIDESFWDPARDPLLAERYDEATRGPGKRANRHALQHELGLPRDDAAVLIGLIGRLTGQKGYDLVLDALPALLAEQPIQLALLGSGDKALEAAFAEAARVHPGRIGLRFGYDEGLAHRIEAGADLFLMPSRFEPCGLNQMYSQRYGTPPIVHRVGGLADTVTDATPASLAAGTATGLAFAPATAAALADAVQRGVRLVRDRSAYAAVQTAGMRRDFSWRAAAEAYRALYRV